MARRIKLNSTEQMCALETVWCDGKMTDHMWYVYILTAVDNASR